MVVVVIGGGLRRPNMNGVVSGPVFHDVEFSKF